MNSTLHVVPRTTLALALIGISILALGATDVRAQQCTTAPTGMISWWPGTGGGEDIVGSNHGTLVNGTGVAAGKVGVAFSFDGVDDHVQIPDSVSLDVGTAFTIDAWFKTDDVTKIDPGTGSAVQVIMTYGNSSPDGKLVGLDIADGVLSFFIRGRTALTEDLFGTSTIVNDTWYHATATYDGTTAKLYLDGVLEDSRAAAINIDADSRIWIGQFQNPRFFNINFAFDGLIDEVDVFGRALGQVEIQAIVAAGSQGKCKNAQSLLFDLAAIVIELNLKQGITNSLDAKLDAALRTLQDMNQNNDGAACNNMQSFINAVEAQRGGKLTHAEADLLVAVAEEIRASLGCV